MEILGFTFDWWTGFGFFAQFLFFMRFIVQWIASEKKGESTIPIYFWYFSIAGAILIVIYSVGRRDIVFVIAQSLALFIYARNLSLIYKKERKSGNLAKYKSKNPIKRFFVKLFLGRVEKLVKGTGGKRIIDVGCGEGQAIKYLKKKISKLEIVGVDISRQAVELARKDNPEVKFLVGDVNKIDKLVGNEKFDLVMCLEVLEHLDRPEGALEAFGRLNSDKFLFSVPNEPFFSLGNFLMLKNISRFGNDSDHKQRWTKGEFAKLVKKHFKVIKVETAGFWTIVMGEKSGKS